MLQRNERQSTTIEATTYAIICEIKTKSYGFIACNSTMHPDFVIIAENFIRQCDI